MASVFGRTIAMRPLFVLCVCLYAMLVYCGQILWPNSWMDQDATWCRGRPLPRWHCITWGPSSPHGKGHSSPPPPLFGPCLLWPNGRPSQQLLICCYFLYVIFRVLFWQCFIVVCVLVSLLSSGNDEIPWVITSICSHPSGSNGQLANPSSLEKWLMNRCVCTRVCTLSSCYCIKLKWRWQCDNVLCWRLTFPISATRRWKFTDGLAISLVFTRSWLKNTCIVAALSLLRQRKVSSVRWPLCCWQMWI